MITIADNNFESYKTTLDVEDREVVKDCEIINPAALNGVTKEIKRKAFTFTSVLNGISGMYEINTIFADDFIGNKASGVDYTMRFNFTYYTIPSQRKLLYSYNATGALQFFRDIAPATSSTVDYHISDLNCTGGSYANDLEQFYFDFEDALPFDIDLEIIVLEECPTAITYTTCEGVELELEGGSNDEATGTIESLYPAPEDIAPEDVFVRKRETFKSDIDFGACDTFNAKHKATIYSADINDPTHYMIFDTGFNYIQVKLTGVSAFTNPVQAVFENIGLVQTQTILIPVTGIPTTITSALESLTVTLSEDYTLTLYEVILGVPTPISISTFAEVNLYAPSLADTDCPCSCDDGCLDESVTIVWRNNCGESVTTIFEAQVKGGNYIIEGEEFKTYSGEEVFPEITQRNEYTLAITKYSDEVYKALAYLIANNLDIEINGVTYYIKPLTITPQWDTFSRYGSVQIPIIEKDSIRTIRRNCC